MGYQTVNPYDNQVVASFEDLTNEQVTKLLAQAQKTFELWSQKTFLERAEVCWRAAMILRERPDEFARLLTLEMGKLYAESLGEVELTAQILSTTPTTPRRFWPPSCRTPPAPMATRSWSAARSG